MLVQKRAASEINISERHQIIQDFLSSNKSKAEIWLKYTGQTEEHGQILRWMRRYGYSDMPKKINFAPVMSKKDKTISEDSLDTAKLKQRIKELEKALEYAELKATAYSTMIDVAEEELKISIRKK